VPKLNTPKYVTLQKLTAKIEHNDIWHFVDWINFIGIAWFLSMYFIYL
jgi:hypothetical protein